MTNMGPIVVYGGGFDPCHIGHLAVIRALTEAELGKVVVMPSYEAASYLSPAHQKDAAPINPHQKKHRFSYDVRCKLLDLSLANEGLSHASISHLERGLGGESITTRTIRHIDARPLWWAMGQDQLRCFDLWHNAQNLFFDMSFCVFSRHSSHADSTKLIDDLKNLLFRMGYHAGSRKDKQYNIRVDHHESYDLCQIIELCGTKKIRSTQVMLMQFVPPAVSSTQIRRLLKAHQAVDSDQMSPPAYQYLVEHRLI